MRKILNLFKNKLLWILFFTGITILFLINYKSDSSYLYPFIAFISMVFSLTLITRVIEERIDNHSNL